MTKLERRKFFEEHVESFHTFAEIEHYRFVDRRDDLVRRRELGDIIRAWRHYTRILLGNSSCKEESYYWASKYAKWLRLRR